MSTTEYELPPQTDENLSASTEGGGEDYPECPSGAWAAVCVDVVYRGTQPNRFDPTKPPAHKISLHFQVDAYDEDDEPARRTDGKRFVLSAWFTRSLHPKSNLRKTLASWRGQDFSDEQAEVFNLNNLIGAFCLVNVVHKPKKDGSGVRAVIESITRLPKGMAKFEPEPYVRIKDRKPGEQYGNGDVGRDVPPPDYDPSDDPDLPF